MKRATWIGLIVSMLLFAVSAVTLVIIYSKKLIGKIKKEKCDIDNVI